MRGRSKFDLPLSFALLSLTVLLAGCVTSPFSSLTDIADDLARPAGWYPSNISTSAFQLRVYRPRQHPQRPHITIYLEGDGRPFITPTRISADPTPTDPQALRLALMDPNSSAYIARPCQYTLSIDKERCHYRYWTYERYSDAVVTSMSQAVDVIKSRFGAKEITLVGFSGGGAVAAILAARRDDIAMLVTVSANLDIDFWTDTLNLPRLEGSLNPALMGHRLRQQPQRHFVGLDDETVPPAVAQSYATKIDQSLLRTIKYIENADHDCCWTELWPDIIRSVRP